MKLKSFAIIDTNIVISGLTSHSFPRDVLELIKSGNVIPVFDKRILNEYYDVLCREKFHFSNQIIYDTLYLMVDSGIYIKDVEKAKEDLKDRKDIPFFEVKESSSEFDTYLVTGNIKDFPRQRTIITPKEFLNILYTLDNFIQNDFDYEKIVHDLIATQLSTPKYTSGKELTDKIFNTTNKTIKKDYFER